MYTRFEPKRNLDNELFFAVVGLFFNVKYKLLNLSVVYDDPDFHVYHVKQKNRYIETLINVHLRDMLNGSHEKVPFPYMCKCLFMCIELLWWLGLHKEEGQNQRETWHHGMWVIGTSAISVFKWTEILTFLISTALCSFMLFCLRRPPQSEAPPSPGRPQLRLHQRQLHWCESNPVFLTVWHGLQKVSLCWVSYLSHPAKPQSISIIPVSSPVCWPTFTWKLSSNQTSFLVIFLPAAMIVNCCTESLT